MTWAQRLLTVRGNKESPGALGGFMRGMLFLLCILLLPQPTLADVYRCEKNGKTRFQDVPCPGADSDSNKLALPKFAPAERQPDSKDAVKAPSAGATDTWPEKNRASYVSSFIRDCVKKQHEDAFSKYMTETQINEYCSCTAERIVATIPMDDFGKAFQAQDFGPLRPRQQAASDYCNEGLAKKWAREKARPRKEGKI